MFILGQCYNEDEMIDATPQKQLLPLTPILKSSHFYFGRGHYNAPDPSYCFTLTRAAGQVSSLGH